MYIFIYPQTHTCSYTHRQENRNVHIHLQALTRPPKMYKFIDTHSHIPIYIYKHTET